MAAADLYKSMKVVESNFPCIRLMQSLQLVNFVFHLLDAPTHLNPSCLWTLASDMETATTNRASCMTTENNMAEETTADPVCISMPYGVSS